jgi:type II secretory pathway pseudopilin PulG
MTTKPTIPPANEIDDDSRPFGGLQGVVVAVLALLLVVMLGQTVYLLSYGHALRESQDALVCQWQITQQLREAAARERTAQRTLLAASANRQNLPATERETASRLAVNAYLDVLAQNDRDRAALPQCPDPRGTE